jgi:hypothetical protein
MPPLIDATRRGSGGRSDKFLLPAINAKDDAKKDKPDAKAKEDKK